MIIQSLLVGFGFLTLIAFGSWLSAALRQMGAEQERLQQVEKDLQVVKKQAEIMAQNKSVDDVANDLDNGTF